MAQKLTTAEFIEKAVAVHGVGRYDYSRVEYKGSAQKVQIGCPTHGVFEQAAVSHLKGIGCAWCSGSGRMTTKMFISKAIEVHGSKYDYSKAIYLNSKSLISIDCPTHGEFQQTAGVHTSGRGCYKCGLTKKASFQSKGIAQFIAEAQVMHDNKYDYSQVLYIRGDKKVKIICPIHGIFEQRPNNHIQGQGCSKCGDIRVSQSGNYGLSKFLENAKSAHGSKYNYSQVVYINSKKKVKIICPVHGIFEQIAYTHMSGKGCRQCGNQAVSKQRTNKISRVLAQFQAAHGNRYGYEFVNYIGNNKSVKILCTEHGMFEQRPSDHKRGVGCPKCANEKKQNDWVSNALGRQCILYFLYCSNENESFYKVGITAMGIDKRYASKSALANYQYKIIAEHKSFNAAAIYEWEQAIIETFAHLRYEPQNKFPGATECFSSCDEILSIFPL